jgi:hypothetical protein
MDEIDVSRDDFECCIPTLARAEGTGRSPK